MKRSTAGGFTAKVIGIGEMLMLCRLNEIILLGSSTFRRSVMKASLAFFSEALDFCFFWLSKRS